MPLDGHSYLVSQGWGGKGTGLRPGAISRAIAIPKKKNLAGVGKDRDEAFPFWDQSVPYSILLFASLIQLVSYLLLAVSSRQPRNQSKSSAVVAMKKGVEVMDLETSQILV
jgi:hypothetical protein